MSVFYFVKTKEPIIGIYSWLNNKTKETNVKFCVRISYCNSKNSSMEVLQCGGFNDSTTASLYKVLLRCSLELYGKGKWKQIMGMSGMEIRKFAQQIINDFKQRKMSLKHAQTYTRLSINELNKTACRQWGIREYFKFMQRHAIKSHAQFEKTIRDVIADTGEKLELEHIHKEVCICFKFCNNRHVRAYDKLYPVVDILTTKRATQWFNYIQWQATQLELNPGIKFILREHLQHNETENNDVDMKV